jgi:hypothetical protein
VLASEVGPSHTAGSGPFASACPPPYPAQIPPGHPQHGQHEADARAGCIGPSGGKGRNPALRSVIVPRVFKRLRADRARRLSRVTISCLRTRRRFCCGRSAPFRHHRIYCDLFIRPLTRNRFGRRDLRRRCDQDHPAGPSPSPRKFDTDHQSPPGPNAASIPSASPQPVTYPTGHIALIIIPQSMNGPPDISRNPNPPLQTT